MTTKRNLILLCLVLLITFVAVLALAACDGAGNSVSAGAEAVPAQRPSPGSSGRGGSDRRSPESSPAFPRLGMWWPDPYEQPLDEIARYDFVILGDWAAEFIAPQ